MSVWDTYSARLCANGCPDDPHRASQLDHIRDNMRRKITSSLSYQQVLTGDSELSVAIIDTTEFTIKKIFSMPGETLPHGTVIDWADSKWLITEVNPHSEFCTEGRMQQCNHILQWIDEAGILIQRWCIVEDGTKYLVGESARDIMTIGDARIAVTIGKDNDTSKLCRGMRFLIDDMDSSDVLAYEITKPNKLFNVYNGVGIFRFILSESNVTDNDNVELRIADYYNWAPKREIITPDKQDCSALDSVVSDAIENESNRHQHIKESGVWL